MPNELEVAKQFEIVITPEQKELVKKTVFPDATDAELQLFFFDCTRRGIHPLDKLIHPTKRNGKYTPITSIDLFRQRASDSGEHMGTDDAVYTGPPAEHDFTASVTVYKHLRGEKCAFTATARWSEYFPGEKQGFMWQKMPHLMLAKCAEALALRKAFPQQLHGLYTNEEMAQAETPVRASIPQVRPRNDATMVQAATDKYTGEPIRQQDGAHTEGQSPANKLGVAEPSGQPTSDAAAHLSPSEYCRQQAEQAPERVVDIPQLTFGKHKGKSINHPDIPNDYLSWLESQLKDQMKDPKYARYRDEKQRLLDAIRGELIERNAMPMNE